MESFSSRSYQPRQSQFGAQGRSTGPLAPVPTTDFQSIEDFEFYRVGTTSYRISVTPSKAIHTSPYLVGGSILRRPLGSLQGSRFSFQKLLGLACWNRPIAQVKLLNLFRSQTHKDLSHHQNCLFSHILLNFYFS